MSKATGRKGGTGCSIILLPGRAKPKKRELKRHASVTASIARYCPCGATIIRTRRPQTDEWRATCSRFCGATA